MGLMFVWERNPAFVPAPDSAARCWATVKRPFGDSGAGPAGLYHSFKSIQKLWKLQGTIQSRALIRVFTQDAFA